MKQCLIGKGWKIFSVLNIFAMVLLAISLVCCGSLEEDIGEALERVNVKGFVIVTIRLNSGELVSGAEVKLKVNKYIFENNNLKPTGDEFRITLFSSSSGTVEWGGWSYNINEEEIIIVDIDPKAFIGNDIFRGFDTIFFFQDDTPSATKSTTITLTKSNF